MAKTIDYGSIYAAVCRIPPGRVATYGQIARLAGNPKAARGVGNALHNNPSPEYIPCFRVVNAGGQLAGHFGFGGAAAQRALLEEDGVCVVNDRVDLKVYQWRDEDE